MKVEGGGFSQDEPTNGQISFDEYQEIYTPAEILNTLLQKKTK